MRQQINLFQPILRAEPKLFGASTAAITFAIVVVALVGLWGFGAYKVTRLEQTTESLRDEQRRLEASLATVGSMRAARETPAELKAKIAQAERELAGRTRALELLRAGAAGRTTGFAGKLEALARRHLDGVWIDRLALSGSTEAMSLGGATFDPDLVPRYLQSLSQESVLAGARFDELAIERPHDRAGSQLRFSASSLVIPAPTPSGKDDAGGAT
jgi:Tfp pilus assembly protein PilN